MNIKFKKVIIAGGGTGGHLFPAVAIGEELENEGILVKYIGSKNGIESNGKFIEKNKIELLDLRGFARDFKMSSIVKNIVLPFKIFKSYLKVKRVFKNFNPDLVIGTGGYSCALPLYVAIKNNILTAIQEQNVLPGLVTRKFSNKVDAVFISFDKTKEYLNRNNYFLTGTPIRSQIRKIDAQESKKIFGLDLKKFTILIMGGSQGARSVNNHFQRNHKKYLNKNIQLIWQTGSNSGDIIKKIKDHNIKMFDFIDNVEYAYSASDLIVSRAGATAISEILYLGKPSILIPYPYAADNHQELNAKVLDNIEAAVMVKESELEKNVLENKIFEIIDSNQRINLLKKNALEFSKRDSSFLIKEKIKEMILDAR